MQVREVFLSHSHHDREFVVALANMLRRHGIPVWHSQTNIVAAQKWHDEIGAALRRCDWFLIVLTPNAINSMWVQRELLFALRQNRFERKIIPVLYQPCNYEEFSWTLSNYQIADFTQSFEAGCRELLRVWGFGFKPE